MHYSIKRTPLAAAMLLALNTPLYSPQADAAPGDMVGVEFQVNTYITDPQVTPVIAMDADGGYVVAWSSYNQEGVSSNFGIYAKRYNADGTTVGGEFRVNSHTISSQHYPSIAMDADGDFVVAWSSSSQDGDLYGIYAQRYNANGTAAGGEFQVNTYTTNQQRYPSIAMDADGDFVVAWQSDGQDGDVYGIYAQRYNANGTAAGGEFQVNTYNAFIQRYPSIAMDADGDFVVAWASIQDGDSNGIYAQRYNADGTTIGGEFKVNTYTTSSQIYPSIAMDADGDFVVAWQSNGQDSDLYGIYSQRYNADGTAAGGEFKVNTFTTNSQGRPRIAMDADGDFVVVWTSNGQDGDLYGIDAQRYNADGTTAGVEFKVNTYTTSWQYNPIIAMDADGDFAVAWTSNGQDGNLYGVYAQRYAGAGNFAVGTVDLNLVVQDDTDPVSVGNNFVYSLITSNYGSGIAMDVNLNDPLPAGVSYVSNDGAGVGWNCTEAVGTLSCNKPFMAAAESNTIFLTVSPDALGTVSNTVTVNAAQTDLNAADNTDTQTTTINDTTAPVITLLGENPISLAQNSTFTDPGSSVTDNVDTGLTATVTGSVNTATVGSYVLSYNVSDAAGNIATTVIRTVNVVDVVAPVITLLGNNPISLVQNSVFIDPGSTVTDNVDTGLTATVTGSVDTTTAGSYILSYDVTDAAGNVATTVTRTVNVTDGEAPVITLLGSNPISLLQNSNFTDPGSTVTDNVDIGLTATVSGSIDTTTAGSYILSYDVTDAAGNVATTVTRTVNVVDTVAPVITLLGTSPMTVALNTTFTDPGSSVTDNVDTGLIATATGTVDTATVGSYVLSYNVTDVAGNAATTVIRTVNVIVDDIAPVITLLGDNPISLIQNSVFTDPGSTVTDNVDTGLTATVTGSVNTSIAGIYELSYNVTDAAGNAATTVTRTVNVTDGEAPVITLLGTNPITVQHNSTFTDPGSSVTDNVDIGLTAIVTGSVNTATIGSYELRYDVTDAAGNVATTVTRTVNVVDTVAPVITLQGGNPITLVQNSVFTDPGSTVSDNVDVGLTATVTGSVDTTTAGSYILSYDVTDAAGNDATTVTRTVNVTDGEAPVITLLGNNSINLVQNSVFTDLGSTVSDNVDVGLTATVTGSVNTSIAGIYELSYNVTDAAGNAATTVTRTVNVTDGEAPVITLLGTNIITVQHNSAFTDPGSSVTDNVDTGLTATVTGSVNTATIGSYELRYDVADATGNVATTVTRTVNVIDTVAPVITLLGTNSITVLLNNTFTDPGSNVTDNVDTGLTAIVTGSVDTSTVGSYELSYDVTDASGNAATTVIRTVNVIVDDIAPVITLLGDNPISLVQNSIFTDPGSSVTDNVDTGLTATVTGSVDTATVGSYELSYNVTDASGNAATTVTRTVEVTAIPVSGGGGGGSFGMLSMLFALPLWLRRRFKNEM